MPTSPIRKTRYSQRFLGRNQCDAYLSISGPDCDDSREKTYPGAPETCLDYQDNQCPGDPGYGTVDEGCPMAFIPAGCFDMDDAFSEGNSDELLTSSTA